MHFMWFSGEIAIVETGIDGPLVVALGVADPPAGGVR